MRIFSLKEFILLIALPPPSGEVVFKNNRISLKIREKSL